jgi:hypothetical protein
VSEDTDLLVARARDADLLGFATDAAADLCERERLRGEIPDPAPEARWNRRCTRDHILIVAHELSLICADFAPVQL